MAFNKKIGMGVAVVFVAGIWFGGNYIVSKEIESKAKALLTDNKLENVVKWGSVKGRINKTATFYDVVITNQKGGKEFSIEKIDINDFDESDDSFLLDLTLTGIADGKGQSPSKTIIDESGVMLQSIDTKDLPLANASILVQHLPQHSKIKVSFNQDKLINKKVTLNLSDTDSLFYALKNSSVKDGKPLSQGMSTLALLSGVKFDSMYVNVKEKGLFKHLNEQGFTKNLGSSRECLGFMMMIGLAKGEQNCNSFFNFTELKKDTLNISIAAKKPYPVLQLAVEIEKLQRSPIMIGKFLQQFDIDMSN